MKLNVKRTVTIGFGFLTIMMLWQVYNWTMPKFLNDYLEGVFSGDKLVVGIIMSLDNLFALFMIPLMSKWSDGVSTKMGRRMPFITVGIILAAAFFVFLPYTNASGNIWLLIANILMVLICMNIYRSPCVALMPDVTPKELRSKGNSIINILGGVGTALGFVVIFISGSDTYLPFYITSAVMLVCLAILLVKVNENKFVQDYKECLRQNGIDEEADKKEDEEKGSRSVANKRNLWLVLLVVFFVYMANNAVETFISLYAEKTFLDTSISLLGFTFSVDVLVIIPFGVGTFAFAVPAAVFADKIGRKNVVLLGTVMMGAGYLSLSFFTAFSWAMLGIFLLVGFGFAFIVINIYPMVLENCDAQSTGKYTGMYYTASMLAQSVTPALCGLFMSGIVFNSMRALFPYATVFMLVALVITALIKKEKTEITEN